MPRATRARSVFDTATLGVCLIASFITLILPPQIRDRSAGALRRTVVAPLAELQRRAELSRAAFASYDTRMKRLGDLATLQTDNRALQSENVRLRALMGLAARLGWGFVAADAAPSQLESEAVAQHQLMQSFNITAGSNAGVQPYSPVVGPEGLLGMVKSVDLNAAIVISYLDPDFRVSASTPNDSAYGIVQAHLGSGAARGLLEMRGVAFRSPLKAGQLIISSGLGGTYPRGIAVGTVIGEIQTTEKWARTYLLQPAASLSSLGPVFVLLKKRSDAGVANVWTSLAAADSAARGIAAAGDSAAREAAIREMEARRAALDSLRDTTAAITTPDSSAVPRPAVPRPTVPAGAVPATPPSRPTGDTTRPRPGAAAPRPNGDSATRPIRPTVPRPTVPVP